MRLRNLLLAVMAMTICLSAIAPTLAQGPDNNGRYYDLRGSYPCARDVDQYGQYNVYGYWKGGNWCGQYMPAGYYVYVDGIWYVWRRRRR